MNGGDLISALAGSSSRRPVSGVSWIPPESAQLFLERPGPPKPATDIAMVAGCAQADFAFVASGVAWAGECVEALHERGIAAVWAVPGPLGRVAAASGWPELLRRSAVRPASLAVELAEQLHGCADDIRRAAESGADAVVVADDLGADAGWLVSPDFALSVVLPRLAHLAAVGRDAGLPMLFHSDGDVRPVFGALAEAGYEGVHLAPRQEALPAVTRAAAASGLVYCGGVAVRDLPHTTAPECVSRIAELAAVSPLIVCDDGGVDSAEDLHRSVAVLRELRKVT